jgi:PAS domain S-box-containing protein
MSFEDLSREQLLELIDEFVEQQRRRTAELDAQANEQKHLIQELRLYQVELEMQNRELKQAQLDLEESRDHYGQLFDHAPLAYLALDERCIVERANGAATSLLRSSAQQLIGRSLLELTGNPPELAQLLALSSHQPLSNKIELVLFVRGERIDAEAMVTSSYDLQSRTRVYRCALLDVSARKRAERDRDRALSAERALHQCFQTLDQIHLAVGSLLSAQDPSRLQQMLGSVTDSVLQLFGARSAAVVIESPHAGSTPVCVYRGHPQPSDTSVSLSAPLQISGRRLGEVYLSIADSAPASHGQTTTEYVKTLELIADRLALGLELARHQQTDAEERRRLLWLDRMRQEFSAAADVESVVAAIQRGTNTAVGELAVASAAYVREGDELRLVRAAHRAPEHERVTHRLARIARRGLEEWLDGEQGATHGWLDAQRGTSFARWATSLEFESVLLVPLVARQRRLGLLCFALDASGSDRQGELVRTLHELSLAASNRLDSALLMEQLRGAVDARDTLLALVAHDLRSPLNAIALTASSLSEPPPHHERRRTAPQFALIQRSIQRMSHLIEDLLTAANIETGQFAIQASSSSPMELAYEACALNHPAAKSKRIELELDDRPRELPRVSADRDRVLQVLTNLLVNAFKFAPAGSKVTVEIDRVGEFVRFSVRDRGPGLLPEQLAQVFRRYWRGRSTSSGLGLGLFIAEHIVRAHRGKIWVESAPGAGAAFYFSRCPSRAPRRSGRAPRRTQPPPR